MSGQEGFIDLRLNHQRDQTAESFWPSFTDIMTVVVMIFMLAMLILLARNMELLKELRATIWPDDFGFEYSFVVSQSKMSDGLAAGEVSAGENERSHLPSRNRLDSNGGADAVMI